MRLVLFLIVALTASGARSEPIPQHIHALSVLGYRLASEQFCASLGYRMDERAWQTLFKRVGLEGDMADYQPRGRYERLAEISIGSMVAGFRASPEGGCLNTITWARHWYPDLAPHLISAPKSY